MRQHWKTSFVIGSAWVALFYLLPLILITSASFATPDVIGRPTYGWTLSNYQFVFQDAYLPVIYRTFAYAAAATVIALLVGYPTAYAISRFGGRLKIALLLLILVPWLADYLVRIYAWVQILGHEGPALWILRTLGLADESSSLLGTPGALLLGLVYSFLPFMILTVFLSVERLDTSLLEAADDLYATPLQKFLRITVPQTAGGIVSGCQLVFLLSLGDFAVAQFLGGSQYMIGNLIRDQLATAGSLPFGAALTVTLLLGLLGVGALALVTRATSGRLRRSQSKKELSHV
ncbi:MULTISPECIES: ABC transporter permease [unclassified Leucobacter]|uniref:ABC transporter permease n=1 Tax=unclassified Leucobacter TaxID=2621730 RepID=UPI00165D4B58|nr:MULTISPECIES: ABC transporter permease [unclassified Leucobacter]MBC9936528.1 ABC transporter permease [Leucobacter sp. cx-87]